MATDDILITIDGAVAAITLNRPGRLNALTEAAAAALQTALREVAATDIRAVVLTGSGRAFCAGQDLSERAAITRGERIDLGAALARNWNPIIRLIRDLPKPVIAAVNGLATGAGANLALSCDIVLAARSARFIQPFSNLGLVPDAGGTFHLPRLVGLARAKALMMLGEPIGAEQAAAWGLIWKAVDDDALMAEAVTMAQRLATQPTYAIGLIKSALDASARNTLDDQLALESELQSRAGYSPDYAEALRAFFEKRAPTFSGRPGADEPK